MSTMEEQKVAMFVLQMLSEQRDADPQNLLIIWSEKMWWLILVQGHGLQ